MTIAQNLETGQLHGAEFVLRS